MGKGQVPKLDWFKDARHELVVHTECTPPESLIDELVGDRCDSANTVIVKYDADLVPHALIVNNRILTLCSSISMFTSEYVHHNDRKDRDRASPAFE